MEENQKINHWCVVCGKGYHACDSCNKERSFTPWRVLTDTIEHYKIFMILKNYNNQLISKESAQEKLLSMDLTDMEFFKESAKKVLNQIFSVDFEDINSAAKTQSDTSSRRKSSRVQKSKEVQSKTLNISASVEQEENYE